MIGDGKFTLLDRKLPVGVQDLEKNTIKEECVMLNTKNLI
jgi:hypothetical protein